MTPSLRHELANLDFFTRFDASGCTRHFQYFFRHVGRAGGLHLPFFIQKFERILQVQNPVLIPRFASCHDLHGSRPNTTISLTQTPRQVSDLIFICPTRAVVDWFGPIEFAQMDPQFVRSGKGSANHSAAGSPESKFLENPVETATAELIKKANPLEYIHADLPAFIIEHGDADSTVPVQQSIALAEKLKAVLTAHKLELQVLPGARHGDPQFESDQNLQRVLEFLNRALPQS